MAVLSPKKTDVSNFDEEQNDVQSFRKEKFRLHQITRTQSLSSGARESPTKLSSSHTLEKRELACVR